MSQLRIITFPIASRNTLYCWLRLWAIHLYTKCVLITRHFLAIGSDGIYDYMSNLIARQTSECTWGTRLFLCMCMLLYVKPAVVSSQREKLFYFQNNLVARGLGLSDRIIKREKIRCKNSKQYQFLVELYSKIGLPVMVELYSKIGLSVNIKNIINKTQLIS